MNGKINSYISSVEKRKKTYHDSLVHVFLLAAILPQADQSATHQTQTRLLGHRIALEKQIIGEFG